MQESFPNVLAEGIGDGLNFYTDNLKIIWSSARACQGWAETTYILHQGSLEKKESSVVSFTFLTSSGYM